MKVKNILRAVARFARAKEAVSAMEYAIVVGVVVAGVGGAVVAFTDSVETAIDDIATNVTSGAGTVPAATLGSTAAKP